MLLGLMVSRIDVDIVPNLLSRVTAGGLSLETSATSRKCVRWMYRCPKRTSHAKISIIEFAFENIFRPDLDSSTVCLTIYR